VLQNGLGRYEQALCAAQQGAEDSLEVRLATWGLVELIEAAARSGEPDLGADALDRLSQTTAVSGTDWALGIEARSRALLSDRDTVGYHLRKAFRKLGVKSRHQLEQRLLKPRAHTNPAGSRVLIGPGRSARSAKWMPALIAAGTSRTIWIEPVLRAWPGP
jgi:hypothetical protein